MIWFGFLFAGLVILWAAFWLFGFGELFFEEAELGHGWMAAAVIAAATSMQLLAFYISSITFLNARRAAAANVFAALMIVMMTSIVLINFTILGSRHRPYRFSWGELALLFVYCCSIAVLYRMI